MGSNPASGLGVGDDYPVYNVSWNDIAGPGGFTETLNVYLGTTAFRLLTEAEWDRARAGTQMPHLRGSKRTQNQVFFRRLLPPSSQ